MKGTGVFKDCPTCGGLGKVLMKERVHVKGGGIEIIRERQKCPDCKGKGYKK